MIGKLPFSGKMSIAPLIFNFYNSTNSIDRKKSYFIIAGLLSAFVLFHGVQAQMGIKGLGYNAPMILKIVFGFYACVNVCVSLTQFYLFVRCTHFLLTSKTYPKIKRDWKGHTDKQKVLMAVVTLGGQIIFLICYLSYS